MMGGIDNGLFFQGFGGIIGVAILVLFLRWAFPTKKDPKAKAHRRELKKSLRRLLEK
jgi:hypothetical protein